MDSNLPNGDVIDVGAKMVRRAMYQAGDIYVRTWRVKYWAIAIGGRQHGVLPLERLCMDGRAAKATQPR